MCGIAGYVAFKGSQAEQGVLQRMTDSLAHRGPDDAGVWTHNNVGLGHRRLSILDLSARGRQPMDDASDNYVITFNGEIYNYQELRAGLKNQGYSFRTNTDTEVIMALYDRHGAGMLPLLEGMWAFVIYDKRQRRLFGARDRFGKKPFYYFLNASFFAFASQPKALRAVPGFQVSLHQDGLGNYLTYGYIPEPETIWKDVHKLPHASYFELEVTTPQSFDITRYWNSHQLLAPDAALTGERLASGIREHLATAVQRRLVADVPVGAFLSGGIDSSAVVALMQQVKTAGSELHTFSLGFDHPRYDETHYAEAVAQQLKTTHHVKRLNSIEALEILQKLPEFYDEPFADSSMIPTYAVSELAKQYVTVSLSGDGGDELWGGYLNYVLFAYLRQIKGVVPQLGYNPIASIAKLAASITTPALRNPGLSLGLQGLQWLKYPLPEIFARISSFHSEVDAKYFKNFEPFFQEKHWEDNVMQTYLNTHLVDDFLVKVDRASMAHGLEVRCPFLDRDFAAFALQVPVSQKINVRGLKYQLKHGLREALKPLLPTEVTARGKQGFSLPMAQYIVHEWQPFVREHIANVVARNILPISKQEVDSIFRAHVREQADYSQFLYALTYLDLWAEKWLP